MKILVVSHNCFSSTQNMGKTFVSLFSQFEKHELMQLYVYPSIPNVDVCDSYFRITDQQVVKAILKRKHCGGEVQPDLQVTTGTFESPDTEKRYNSINRNTSLTRRARDVAWKLGKWKSKELKAWLENGKPDAVFYALGDASFSQNIAMWVARYLGIPLITYVCDEYYFSGKQAKGFDRLINAGMLANIKKTIRRSQLVISICDDLGELYQTAFGTPYRTIMTGSAFASGSIVHEAGERTQISYIGNLALNRWRSILDIQDALNRYHETHERRYELVYYGREHTELSGKVTYGGFLDPAGIREVMGRSYMLVHIETFDREFRARLKYSVSTKIADSLASGTCLLAYGPEELASIRHLERNACAGCITDKAVLDARLSALLDDPALVEQYAEAGMKVASLHHSSERNSRSLYEAIAQMIASRSEDRTGEVRASTNRQDGI